MPQSQPLSAWLTRVVDWPSTLAQWFGSLPEWMLLLLIFLPSIIALAMRLWHLHRRRPDAECAHCAVRRHVAHRRASHAQYRPGFCTHSRVHRTGHSPAGARSMRSPSCRHEQTRWTDASAASSPRWTGVRRSPTRTQSSRRRFGCATKLPADRLRAPSRRSPDTSSTTCVARLVRLIARRDLATAAAATITGILTPLFDFPRNGAIFVQIAGQHSVTYG